MPIAVLQKVFQLEVLMIGGPITGRQFGEIVEITHNDHGYRPAAFVSNAR